MKKKECPSCAMEVDPRSKTCPICQYEFATQPRWIQWTAILLIIVFLLMYIL